MTPPGYEFTCPGCNREIVMAFKPPGHSGLCGGCTLLGPAQNRAFQDWQDGRITESAFLQSWEHPPAPETQNPPPAFICPRCKTASWYPEDAKHGYCARCRDFTAPPRTASQ